MLAWGTHWAGSGPGPISSLAYVDGVVAYTRSLPSWPRFTIGAPMYGLDWTTGSPTSMPAHALQYSAVLSLIQSVGATPQRDPESKEMTFTYTDLAGAQHRVWYMDARSVLYILRSARARGLAVGLWRLGREDQSLWSSVPALG